MKIEYNPKQNEDEKDRQIFIEDEFDWNYQSRFLEISMDEFVNPIRDIEHQFFALPSSPPDDLQFQDTINHRVFIDGAQENNSGQTDRTKESRSKKQKIKKEKKQNLKPFMEQPESNGQNQRTKMLAKEVRNFLKPIKKILKEQLRDQQSIISSEAKSFYLNEHSCKEEFQKLFKIQETRERICNLFLKNKLSRLLQFSRVEPERRTLFLWKIKHLRKAFIEKTLPNL